MNIKDKQDWLLKNLEKREEKSRTIWNNSKCQINKLLKWLKFNILKGRALLNFLNKNWFKIN